MPRNINNTGVNAPQPTAAYPVTPNTVGGVYDPQPAINAVGTGQPRPMYNWSTTPEPTTYEEATRYYQDRYPTNTSNQMPPQASRKRLEFLSDKELADVRLKVLEQVTFNGAPQTEVYEQAVALEKWVLGN